MRQADGSRPPGAADAVGLAADALFGALAELAEALHRERPDAPSAPGAVRRPPARSGRGADDLLGAAASRLASAVLPHIDPNALLERVDVQRLVERVDLDRLLDSVDVDRLLDRVDVDELVRRIDLTAATREAMEAIDIGDVIRESTATLGSDVVEDLRVQAMRADDLVTGLVDRLLRRAGPRDTALEGAG
jgi:hypothetical protein